MCDADRRRANSPLGKRLAEQPRASAGDGLFPRGGHRPDGRSGGRRRGHLFTGLGPEFEMAFAAVRNYPGRFAIMGAAPLDRPESRARVAGWREQPGMLGLRYGFLTDPMRQWLHDGTIDWLWTEAEAAGVP